MNKKNVFLCVKILNEYGYRKVFFKSLSLSFATPTPDKKLFVANKNDPRFFLLSHITPLTRIFLGIAA